MWEALEEAIDWRMQFGANCEIRISSEEMTQLSWLRTGTRKVQVQWIN